jgi:hypothetical protein
VHWGPLESHYKSLASTPCSTPHIGLALRQTEEEGKIEFDQNIAQKKGNRFTDVPYSFPE